MSMQGGRGRGRGMGRGAGAEKGPKASFKQLWPYLTENKSALWLAIFLSIVGALVNLAQPLVVEEVQAVDTVAA